MSRRTRTGSGPGGAAKAAALLLAAAALTAAPAWSHTDPPGSILTGVGLSLGVFSDANCTDSIVGQPIAECQQVYLKATLQWQGGRNAAFEGGRWILQTFDYSSGTAAEIANLGAVPCIGGTTDDPNSDANGGRGICAGAPTQLAGACVPYSPTAAEIATGFVVFQALFGDTDVTSPSTGYSHVGVSDLPGASASVSILALVDACDAAATDCWEAEFCDPTEGCVQPPKSATTICRPSAGVCDIAESCDGVNPDCPADEFKPEGTVCTDTDGNVCTEAACDDLGSCDQNYVCNPATSAIKPECWIVIGDTIWADDGDGFQQITPESGCEGASVELVDCAGTPTVEAGDVTDSSGFYQFEVLGVDAACNQISRDFFIQVDTTGSSCEGYEATPQDADNNVSDDIDSDCSVDTGATTCTTYPAGTNDQTIDCGYTVPCDLTVEKTCQIVPPPSTEWNCSDAKPLDLVAMVWDGTQQVDIQPWKGSIGGTPLAPVFGISRGDEVVVTGYAGSPNDVFWEVFEAGTDFAVRLGRSKFHLSCSDSAMNGPEDCGLRQGNGKSNESGLINDWLLDGLGGSGLFFDCTPTPEPGAELCEAFLPQPPSCETLDKPTSLTFKYTGGACPGDNDQGSKSNCTGSIDPSLSVSISSSNSGLTINPMMVEPGQEFTVSGSLGSNTRLTLSNGGGSQINDVHTSCSAPLAVNDEFGALTLVGFSGQRGGVLVNYEYVVTNNSSTSLENVTVVDDKIDLDEPPFFLGPDGDSQTISVVAELTATTENRVDVTGFTASGSECAAFDTALVVVGQAPEPCGECEGGVTELAFRNVGPAGFVEIEDGSATLFAEYMEIGDETPILEGTKSDRKFDGDVKIFLDGDEVAKIHTSCSRAIGIGIEFDGFEVISGRSKDGGPFCEPDCSIATRDFRIEDDEIKWKLKNTGLAAHQIKRIEVTWPSAKGDLVKVEFDGTIWEGRQPPPSFDLASGWLDDPTKRSLEPGQEDELKLRFSSKTTRGLHELRVTFFEGCAFEVSGP